MHLDLSLRLYFFVTLNTLIELLDESRRKLGKTTFCGTVTGVTWSPATLDTATNSVENIPSDTLLRKSHQNIVFIHTGSSIREFLISYSPAQP